MRYVQAAALAGILAIGIVGCGKEESVGRGEKEEAQPNTDVNTEGWMQGGAEAGAKAKAAKDLARRQAEIARKQGNAEETPDEADEPSKTAWRGTIISKMTLAEAQAAAVQQSRETLALVKKMNDPASVRQNVKQWIELSAIRGETMGRLSSLLTDQSDMIQWAQSGMPEISKLADEEGKLLKRIHDDKTLQAAWIQGSIGR